MSNEGHTSNICPRCGEMGPAGRAQVSVPFDLDEAEELAFATSKLRVRKRLICAIALLDEERADRIVAELRANQLFGEDEITKPE